MKHASLLFAIPLLALLSYRPTALEAAHAQSPVSTNGANTKNEIEERVDQVFAAYAKPNSPGCSLGVVENGNFAYRKSYGMGSLELGVPLSSESVFYMGSISKQFTAASIVLAAEQGLLSLGDDVRKYIPELPDYGQPITLRQMLHHTSGLPDALTMLGLSGRHIEDIHTTTELMDFVTRQKTLNFKPGEHYLYSNTEYFLLAEVLKRATKKPLSQFAAENIFKPLGMNHTRIYDDHTIVVPGRVAAYRPGPSGSFLVDWSTNYELVGGGGLMSTVDDLLLWDRNFYTNRLGKGTLVKELQTRADLNDGTHNDYGLGLMMGNYRGLPTVEHGGANFGYRADILRFPEQGFTTIALCNNSNADPDALSRKVADIYLAKQFHDIPPVETTPASFAGSYFDNRTHYLASFSLRDASLVLEGHSLRAIAANRFEDPILGGVVTFSGTVGKMSATVVYNNAVTFNGTKISVFHVPSGALASFVGEYRSDELEATYKLDVESGTLTLRTNWNPPIQLSLILADEFSGGGMTLVFHRNDASRVTNLTLFSGWDAWIRNENFTKVK